MDGDVARLEDAEAEVARLEGVRASAARRHEAATVAADPHLRRPADGIHAPDDVHVRVHVGTDGAGGVGTVARVGCGERR